MRAVVSALVALAVVAGCGGDDDGERLATTRSPSDLEPLASGAVLVAERETGRVVRVEPDGSTRTVASVDVVAEPGQRGLLGLATRGDEVFASWTRAEDGRLVVGLVTPAPTRLVWLGPPSADVANGGRIAFHPDGGLVIGIGDLTDPAAVDDPDAPNGKLLRLDPDEAATQSPTVVSTGWHNPFAFTVLPDGTIWVADNAPGSARERLARGDRPAPSSVVELDGTMAPSGIVVVGDDLLVCGYEAREVRRYGVGRATHTRVVGGCRYDVVLLADGRLAFADDRGVVVR